MAMTKYFFYSYEQLLMRKNIEHSMGRKFKVGHVVVDGVRKPFTELTASSKSRFSDAKLVASGDPTTMNYTEPSSI